MPIWDLEMCHGSTKFHSPIGEARRLSDNKKLVEKVVILSLAISVLALAVSPRSQTRNFPLSFHKITKWVTVVTK